MSVQNERPLWQEPVANIIIPANLSKPNQIAAYAQQLTTRERQQVIVAFKTQSYEMGTLFIWQKAMSSLKRELQALGITFIAELLGRSDITENDNIFDAVTEKEAIKIAEELGIVSQTDALRLRHSQELVSHFSQRQNNENDDSMEYTEAINILLCCVKNVLAKPSIQVAKKFIEFRGDLESKTFQPNDPQCDMLILSPYFFQRLAIVVLLSGIQTKTGAKLDHCLANLNVLLPLLWPKLRDSERWRVGAAYAQVYADGLQTQATGLKQALLKVRGFDYVPESLRSQTFTKAADALIRAHEGIGNFYNELAPIVSLENLGTVIPPQALGTCITALLCVRLGNSYGVAWNAAPIALRMLKQLSSDRWTYYLDKVLPGEIRILEKLSDEKPRKQWISLSAEIFNSDLILKEKNVRDFLNASLKNDENKISSIAKKMVDSYYGRTHSNRIQ